MCCAHRYGARLHWLLDRGSRSGQGPRSFLLEPPCRRHDRTRLEIHRIASKPAQNRLVTLIASSTATESATWSISSQGPPVIDFKYRPQYEEMRLLGFGE